MRSGFIGTACPMADPATPYPAIPIRIVPEPAQDASATPETTAGKRDADDTFYDSWDRFLAIQPKRAKTGSRMARMVEAEKQAVDGTPGDGLQVRERAAKSWQEAAEECKGKVKAIVEECKRLNRKYVDYQFDLEAGPYPLQDLRGVYPQAIMRSDGSVEPPPWVKRVEDIFDKPQFYVDGATPTDVHQGSSGDCWFLAALMAISAKKDLVEKLCVARDELVGVYGFVFYRDGEWVYEVIDDKLYLKVGDDDDLAIVRDWDRENKKGRYIDYDDDKLTAQLQRGGEALYFSHCKSSETWLPLIEKAYAKAHGDYAAVEGGYASEGIEDLTGGVGVVLNPEDIMDKDRFWREQLSQVNENFLFGGGSKRKDSKGVVGGHAYTVLRTFEEGDLRLLQLRNPWGRTEWEGDWSDGSKLWTPEMMIKLGHTFGDDGVFWMSYKDFLKHFPRINRKGPVVFVLSQPDDRYFRGLEGRFEYSLHFRVYKEGRENDHWIVRSLHNSGADARSTRSVSAEIEDLDPGKYIVLIKVTGTRYASALTQQEIILACAVARKEKLLDVGRRLDYALTKGDKRGMEKAVKVQAKVDERLVERQGLKRARMSKREELKRSRLRKKRIDDDIAGKRKAVAAARKVKADEKKQQSNRGDNRCASAAVDEDTAPKNQAVSAVPATTSEESTPNAEPAESSEPKANDVTPPSEPEATPSATDTQPDSLPADDTKTDTEAATKKLSELALDDKQDTASEDPPVSPLDTSSDDDDASDSPPPPEELVDDDFEWDSDIDNPVDSDDDEPDPKNEIFAEDPWNAVCVLGLRVYSLDSMAKVTVVKGENGS
ncbi:hypothetical protein LTR91_005873 [Friedmanniomyces endolithicus]|uniref:Calpain catalytic domain-containing protein n=1 Tax=Friedmanniomyces endolithicus TaxID=329885 RepID=A0AAN6QX65_9PEZI|nr:hypothetical protein LTR57_014147 [Friedmanniomyces endolithicus]KAK0956055.1 hypothetical protein LTS01_023037 [Friedmanniomyces endolithicus]KAK0999935.1 hypothetical protein LTR91_005873 [Friedmanniomyces endolithicus]KAK1030350.1 hypothetical protein LTS16_018921 [Friedmanniomyces endolithicus]